MIDRTKFLNMCRECAMLEERGMFNIPKKVPDNLIVIYKGVEYYPQSYELSFFQDGTVNHIAIIHDLKANAIIHAPLKDIGVKE